MIRSGMSGSGVTGISLFAVDPGETTGWAWCCLGSKELRQYGVVQSLARARRHKSGLLLGDTRFASGQVQTEWIEGREWWQCEVDHVTHINAMMEVCGKMAWQTSSGRVPEITDVVVEDFILRLGTKDRSLLSPVRITAGLLQTWHEDGRQFHLILQSSSDAMNVVTDARLKDWNLWVQGRHARDAVRHLVLWLRKWMADAHT